MVTAWVAFSESSIESGAMRMIPGTHTEQVAHRETFAPDNLLSRGQEVMVEVDEARAVDVLLAPGEMSLHHVRMFHGSPPNRAADRRIATLSATSRPTFARSRRGRGTPPPSCAAWTCTTTSTPRAAAVDLDPRPRPGTPPSWRGRASCSTAAPPPSASASPGQVLHRTFVGM